VVLATGGYGGNPELVRRYLPTIAQAWYFGSAGNDGSALSIGERLGADTGYLTAYQGHGSVATPTGIMVTWATVMHGAVILNRNGERFDDETQGYSEYAEKVLAQPDGVAWLILDERIDGLCRSFADYARLVESGALKWAKYRGAVATAIGAPAESVEASLGEADQAARGDHKDRFGRQNWGAPLEPPFGMVRITGALFHTQGGLLVDEQARVLRRGVPIPGLHAAGGSAAGMSGHTASGYLAGNGLLAALGLGYLAGRSATMATGATL
jgi:fumarate reductase flavoprotein subunit